MITEGLQDSWEYKMLQQEVGYNGVDLKFNARLNELGLEGWELVAVFPQHLDGVTATVTYVFKRLQGR